MYVINTRLFPLTETIVNLTVGYRQFMERWQSLAECAALEMRCPIFGPGVRIPPSPHNVECLRY